jgi:phosphoribosylformimino-5-aminoimidazole carboxamide ribonucleotide (ProFAR) isomerase
MIIPCIDLQGGKAVQLIRGRVRTLEKLGMRAAVGMALYLEEIS